MPKRKAVREPSIDVSDLSPPPNDLDEGAAALANANADLDSSTQPTKKRKTASSVVNGDTVAGAANGATIATQSRTARTRKVKPEPEEEEEASSEEGIKPTPKKRQTKSKVVKREEAEEEDEKAKPLPKGRARKKTQIKGEDDAVLADSGTKPAGKPAKKKRKTKEEKEAEAMPLSARTVGHKLFIGAHVSSAGGQFRHIQLYSTDIQSHSQHPPVQLLTLVQVFRMHH